MKLALKPTETITNPEYETIIARLEDAGRTLMALPDGGFSPGLAQPRYDVVRRLFHDEISLPSFRAPRPDQAAVARMEEAYDWVLRIPADMIVVRRIVQARSLVHPLTDRHLYPWRRLAELLHTDYRLLQRLHLKGIKLIYLGAVQMDHSEVRNSLPCG